MKNHIKLHIIFDLDGTLIDSAPDIHISINILLDENNLGRLTLAQTRSFIGNGSPKLVERAFKHFSNEDISQKDIRDLTKRFIHIYMEHLTEETKLYPHVLTILKQLDNEGHCLSLCTNKPIQPTIAILEAFELSSFFTSIVGGDTFSEKKPSPLPLNKIIDSSDIPRDKTLMVGDSIHDVQAGINASLPTILLTYGYSKIPHKEIPANITIDRFENLPNAIQQLQK